MPPTASPATSPAPPPSPRTICGPMRYVLLVFGWFCMIVGVVGVVLPGLPGTVFLLLALWAFSRSSERFHLWLWTHPRFGAGVRAWHQHGVIPARAKAAAVTMIAASLFILWRFVIEDWRMAAATGAVLALVAAWIVTRPGKAKPENPA